MTRFNINSVCYHCGLKREDFKNAKLFKEHYKNHLVGENFDYKICGKFFATKRKMKDHERFLHETISGCDLCQKTFSNKQIVNSVRKHFQKPITFKDI